MSKKQTFQEDLIIRGIKIIDIAYITCLYVIPTLYVAKILDFYVYPYLTPYKNIPEKDKTHIQLIAELLIYLSINGILAYILRNILQAIPFPFEGVYGFQHLRVKEVSSGQLIALVLIWFSNTIRDKMLLLHNKMNEIFKK